MVEAPVRPRIDLDTTVILDAFESASGTAARLKAIFKGFTAHPGLAVTSDYTLGEVLGKEAAEGWAWQRRFYQDLLGTHGFIELRPLTRALLVQTGVFRKLARDAGRNVRLGDAIHAVTAADAGCRYLFTADKRFVVPLPMSHLTLDEADLAAIEHLLV